MHFFFLLLQILAAASSKMKSYHFNKYTNTEHHYDCLHSSKTRINVTSQFTFCFRHKQHYISMKSWDQGRSYIFLGDLKDSGFVIG